MRDRKSRNHQSNKLKKLKNFIKSYIAAFLLKPFLLHRTDSPIPKINLKNKDFQKPWRQIPFFMNLHRAEGQNEWERRSCGGSTSAMVTNEEVLAGCQDDSPCHSAHQRSGGRCTSNRCFPGTENETFTKHWKYLNKGLSAGCKVKEEVPLCWISFRYWHSFHTPHQLRDSFKGFCSKSNMGKTRPLFVLHSSFNTTTVTTTTTTTKMIIKQVHPSLSIIRWLLSQGSLLHMKGNKNTQ